MAGYLLTTCKSEITRNDLDHISTYTGLSYGLSHLGDPYDHLPIVQIHERRAGGRMESDVSKADDAIRGAYYDFATDCAWV